MTMENFIKCSSDFSAGEDLTVWPIGYIEMGQQPVESCELGDSQQDWKNH